MARTAATNRSGQRPRLLQLTILALLLCLGWPNNAAAELLYAPDAIGEPLPRPTLTAAGHPLLVSNSPEILAAGTTGLMHQKLPAEFRVFVHHTNKSGRLLNLGVFFFNSSTQEARILLEAAESGVPFVSESDPTLAGAHCLRRWLHRQPASMRQLIVPPGGFAVLEIPVHDRATATGMLDGTSDVPDLDVVVASYETRPDAPLELPIAARNAPLRRGLFAHSERLGEVEFTSGLLSWFDVGSPPSGRWSRALPGEYETGVDTFDGGTVENDGNYGVVYRITVKVPPGRSGVSLVLCAAGGLSRFAAAVDGRPYLYPEPIAGYHGWRLLRMDAHGGQCELLLTIPGGSNGALRVYFVPDDLEKTLPKPRQPGLGGR